MTTLQPRPGFDWTRVEWGGPYEVVSSDCSYCGAGIPDEFVPLRLWNDEGYAAVFCRECMSRWWGMESFDEDE